MLGSLNLLVDSCSLMPSLAFSFMHNGWDIEFDERRDVRLPMQHANVGCTTSLRYVFALANIACLMSLSKQMSTQEKIKKIEEAIRHIRGSQSPVRCAMIQVACFDLL
jgi:hypothetical protein